MRKKLLGIGLLVFLAGSAQIFGCIQKKHQVRSEHKKVHQEIIEFYNKSVKAAEARIEADKERYLAHLNLKKKCPSLFQKDTLSSVYIPRVAPRNNHLNCVMKATSLLDEKWESFFQSTGYLSWIYFYDHNVKSMRIYPRTNTQAHYGENLTFEKFRFYSNAVQSYPSGAWSRLGIDVNGTGRILMYSKAVFIPDFKEPAVLALDINARDWIKPKTARITEFSQERGLDHVFTYAFQMNEEEGGISAHEFSTNQSALRSLKPIDKPVLGLAQDEKKGMKKFRMLASQESGKILESELKFNERPHYCTLIHLTSVNLYSLLCTEE